MMRPGAEGVAPTGGAEGGGEGGGESGGESSGTAALLRPSTVRSDKYAADGWRARLGTLMTGTSISNLSTALVVLNMMIMCLPYADMSEAYAADLEFVATVITWIFIVEMFLKVLGLGCASYWSDGWNVLDGTIVIMSIVEMVLTALFAGSGVKLSFLRMLRMLRVARMLRLMKSWKGLYKVISTVVRAIPQMSNVLILVALVSMIFALLGMQVRNLAASRQISVHRTQTRPH